VIPCNLFEVGTKCSAFHSDICSGLIEGLVPFEVEFAISVAKFWSKVDRFAGPRAPILDFARNPVFFNYVKIPGVIGEGSGYSVCMSFSLRRRRQS